MSATFTADDVAAFAELVRPAFEEFAGNGLTDTDALTAAAVKAKETEEREMLRRYNMLHIFTDALSGTYDEFRAEARP